MFRRTLTGSILAGVALTGWATMGQVAHAAPAGAQPAQDAGNRMGITPPKDTSAFGWTPPIPDATVQGTRVPEEMQEFIKTGNTTGATRQLRAWLKDPASMPEMDVTITESINPAVAGIKVGTHPGGQRHRGVIVDQVRLDRSIQVQKDRTGKVTVTVKSRDRNLVEDILELPPAVKKAPLAFAGRRNLVSTESAHTVIGVFDPKNTTDKNRNGRPDQQESLDRLTGQYKGLTGGKPSPDSITDFNSLKHFHREGKTEWPGATIGAVGSKTVWRPGHAASNGAGKKSPTGEGAIGGDTRAWAGEVLKRETQSELVMHAKNVNGQTGYDASITKRTSTGGGVQAGGRVMPAYSQNNWGGVELGATLFGQTASMKTESTSTTKKQTVVKGSDQEKAIRAGKATTPDQTVVGLQNRELSRNIGLACFDPMPCAPRVSERESARTNSEIKYGADGKQTSFKTEKAAIGNAPSATLRSVTKPNGPEVQTHYAQRKLPEHQASDWSATLHQAGYRGENGPVVKPGDTIEVTTSGRAYKDMEQASQQELSARTGRSMEELAWIRKNQPGRYDRIVSSVPGPGFRGDARTGMSHQQMVQGKQGGQGASPNSAVVNPEQSARGAVVREKQDGADYVKVSVNGKPVNQKPVIVNRATVTYDKPVDMNNDGHVDVTKATHPGTAVRTEVVAPKPSSTPAKPKQTETTPATKQETTPKSAQPKSEAPAKQPKTEAPAKQPKSEAPAKQPSPKSGGGGGQNRAM